MKREQMICPRRETVSPTKPAVTDDYEEATLSLTMVWHLRIAFRVGHVVFNASGGLYRAWCFDCQRWWCSDCQG